MEGTYQRIRGMPFPNFNRRNIEGTLAYYPRDGDVIIASYPKTGTTWLQYIALQITSLGESFPPFNEVLESLAPMMEMVGPEAIDRLTGVRIYKHHYRYNMVRKNPKAKTIYIYRNPADTLVSFYHMHLGILEQEVSLDAFFEAFVSGNIQYGSFFEHVLSYMARKDDGNLLLVSYEKLQANPKEGILRIANFIGREYYEYLLDDESLLDDIAERTSFKFMSKNLTLKVPSQSAKGGSEKSEVTVNFFRKGVVGDGKNALSPGQLRKLQAVAKEVMKGCQVPKEWFI